MKNYSKFILFFLFTFVLFVIIRITEPEEIDWSLSFSKEDKIPYGSYILYQILPELFSKQNIQTSQYPIYNTLNGKDYKNSNYIFVNNTFFPDELDTRELLNFVKKGNNVFIAANFIQGKLADTLKLGTGLTYLSSDSIKVNFSNYRIKNKSPYAYKDSRLYYYYSGLDTVNSTILGINNDSRVNFVKINFGDGCFYLNTIPIAFTNYNVLDSLNADYIYKSFSYLPAKNKTIWDEYYKTGRTVIKTPLRYILSTAPLAWAYYILIGSIIIYILIEGKRKQRIIPEIKPFKNTTLEFAGIIGRLYYQQKDHKNIAGKKINYFLDQVRNRYSVKIDSNSDESLEKISVKAGVDFKEVRSIFNFINYIANRSKISESELKKVNSLIESFYKKAGIYGRSN